MNASEFKTALKEVKENLRGLTIQFCTKYSVRPYFSLNDFGQAVLAEEANGNDFRISRAWTKEGSFQISSFEQFKEWFNAGKITGVTFEAYYEPKNFAEAIRYGYTLND